MKHEIIFLGKTKESFIAAGLREFEGRLKHYTSFSIRVLKEKKRGSGSVLIEEQGDLLLASRTPGSHTVVLDSTGKQYSSEEFAEFISRLEMQGVKQVCYLIGGPDGHGDKVLAAADSVLSLSKMTFTHDMARLLLVEQLYRAYTIKAGEQYHK